MLNFIKYLRVIRIIPIGLLGVSLGGGCLLTDALTIQPRGGIPVETVIRQAAASSARGWLLGCNAALKTQNEKFSASVTVDCGSTAVNPGGSPFALYATAARNAANEMIPLARDNRHFYYLESALEDCKSAALTRAFLVTKLYLESTIEVGSRADALGSDDFAASTAFGVNGAGEACFAAIKPTGRIISLGETVVY